MKKLSIFIIILLIITFIIERYTSSIKTTHLSFVHNSGSELVIKEGDRWYAQFAVTPSKKPPEAVWIYYRLKLGLPVTVSVPEISSGEDYKFKITELNEDGNFQVPCSSEEKCIEILRNLYFI